MFNIGLKYGLVLVCFIFSCHVSWASEWLNYGGDLQQTRYIDNDSINTTNVDKLRLKWIFQTGMIGSFANTPVVKDGVMYVSTPYNHLYAINAKTGQSLWRFRYSLAFTNFCCGPNNRGVAVSDDTVFMTTLDANLIAIDKKTGKEVWKRQLADPELGYSSTEAPTYHNGVVYSGIAGAEYGIRGFISAHDAQTGELKWRWYTIPEPEEVQFDGTKGWEGVFKTHADDINILHRDIELEKAQVASGKYADAWQHGGGSAWTSKSIDTKTGLLFAVTGNPSPDLDGSVRPGDNRWTNSLVALDTETGKLMWAYQYLPHDVWDLDSASPPILTRAKNQQGEEIDVVVHGGKTGWVYVHDRQTGELIRRSEPMVEHKNLFALPTLGQGTEMLPGANGGVNWSPGSVNLIKQEVYYSNLHQPMHYEVRTMPWRQGRLWLGGAFKGIPGAEQSGNISAVDLNTGTISWQYKTKQPMIGGTLATSGNLVFTGGDDGYFVALDASNGEALWQFQTGAGVNAAPMGFELDGVLHIAVAAGGNAQINSNRGGSIMVFTVE
jgi:PQQ-dependent dehydrogenase (methanol/ethanol family)